MSFINWIRKKKKKNFKRGKNDSEKKVTIITYFHTLITFQNIYQIF